MKITDNNVILFHLESVNNLFFKMHNECFPNINKILDKSTYYSNYYSSATSTIMTITDLFYGHTEEFEQSTSLENIYSIKPKGLSLFDNLNQYGYESKIYYYGMKLDFGGGAFQEYCKKLSVSSNNFCSSNKNDLLNDMKEFFSDSKKFCCFIQDDESHISEINSSSEGINSDLYISRYKKIDELFGNLLSILKEKRLLSKTVIILYGDHGDELLFHNIYEGYFHAVEPYENISNVPLLIYDPIKIKEKTNSDLISTIDLYNIVLNLLGMQSYSINNQYVFSRNLFSKQKIERNRLNKSYSITNTKYSLIVSNRGLQMYISKIDFTSSRNILDFFDLRQDKLIFHKKMRFLRASHFKYFMNDQEMQDIILNFSTLRDLLINHVNDIYGERKSNMNFYKIRYSYDVKIKRLILFFRVFVIAIKKINKILTNWGF